MSITFGKLFKTFAAENVLTPPRHSDNVSSMTATKTQTRPSARKAQGTSPSLHQELTDRLLAAIESGHAPWQSVYCSDGLPRSIASGRNYRGINLLLLSLIRNEKGYSSAYWGTYKRIASLGGQVRKGEKASHIWKPILLTKDAPNADSATEPGKQRTFFIWRSDSVFNLDQADWPEGLPEQFAPKEREIGEAIAEADKVISDYRDRDGSPRFTSAEQHLAYYHPIKDLINIPLVENITGRDEHYSTTFHEMVHSTGHASRLNREGIATLSIGHRKALYSQEELVAEFGAAFLCGEVGIESTQDNSVAYLAHWAKFLQDAPKAAVAAASAAQRAVDFILDRKVEVADGE